MAVSPAEEEAERLVHPRSFQLSFAQFHFQSQGQAQTHSQK